MRGLALVFLLATVTVGASAQTNSTTNANEASETTPNAPRRLVVPAGTKVLLNLKSPINTKSAHVGDGVYCQTSFPVTLNNVVVIPAGTYVKGEITHVKHAGRVGGRAEILFKFNSMIFPNGYTVDLPGALKSDPGSYNSSVIDEEGTVKADGQKRRNAETVGRTTATGAVIGTAASRSWSGAGIGGAAGAAVGLLLMKGADVRIEQGSALEMVLNRPLTVEVTHPDPANAADNEAVPVRGTNTRLPAPSRPK
jgi:hypothetical protein